MRQIIFIVLKMALIPLTIQGASIVFPRNHLRDVYNVITQANPSTIYVLISKEYSSFTTSFLNLLANNKEIHPIVVETFPPAQHNFQKNNNNTRNYGFKTVIVHILNDNSDDSFNESASMLDKKMKQKSLYKFVVLIKNITRNADNNWLEKLFKQFHNQRILDVTIIYFNEELIFARYNPFVKDQTIKMNYSLAKSDFKDKYIIYDLNGHNFKAVYNPAGYSLQLHRNDDNRLEDRGTNIDMCGTLIER